MPWYAWNKIDPNLVPWNIKDGVSIFGVAGDYNPQDPDLLPDNIRHWVDIFGVVGAYTLPPIANLPIVYQWRPCVASLPDNGGNAFAQANKMVFYDVQSKPYIDVFGETAISIRDWADPRSTQTVASYGRIDKTTYEYNEIDTQFTDSTFVDTTSNARLVLHNDIMYFTTQNFAWNADNIRERDGDTLLIYSGGSNAKILVNGAPTIATSNTITIWNDVTYSEWSHIWGTSENWPSSSATLTWYMNVAFL